MKVENMTSNKGNKVANQFIITADNGDRIFQSYDTVIAKKTSNGIVLDTNSWDYSKTTGEYRNLFLGESKAETIRNIRDGIYTLANLNS